VEGTVVVVDMEVVVEGKVVVELVSRGHKIGSETVSPLEHT
jgi:hypothetical protein